MTAVADNKQPGFVLYNTYAPQFEMLSLEDRGSLVSALFNYSMCGTIPDDLQPVVKMAFGFIKQDMDRDAEKYREKCEINRENGKKGGRPKKQTVTPETERFSEKPKKANININSNENENINPNNTPPTPSEGDARTREKRFKPPTVDEVRVYCAERKNGVDPQRFVDYYTSNGWKVGKSPMKDWKAAVRNWEKNSRDKPLEQTHTDEEWDEFYELAVKRGLGEVG